MDGLVQDCSTSIANALEILQSCTEPSISFNANQCYRWWRCGGWGGNVLTVRCGFIITRWCDIQPSWWRRCTVFNTGGWDLLAYSGCDVITTTRIGGCFFCSNSHCSALRLLWYHCSTVRFLWSRCGTPRFLWCRCSTARFLWSRCSAARFM